MTARLSTDERHVVVVSRDLARGAPIRIDVTATDIAISMTLTDFLDALADAAGSQLTILTQPQLRARLGSAAAVVTEAMKRETVRVM